MHFNKVRPTTKALRSFSVTFLSISLALTLLALPAQSTDDVLVKAMSAELERSMAKLKHVGDAPLYYLSYSVYDVDSAWMEACYGANYDSHDNNHSRELYVDLRVGDPKFDNTHKVRDDEIHFDSFLSGDSKQTFPLTDDPAAIRTSLWLKTDAAFKKAQTAFHQVRTNKNIKVEEDDQSSDFSVEKAHIGVVNAAPFVVDNEAWRLRLKKLSAIYKDYPAVQDSNLTFSATRTKHYLVDSEGTKIQNERLECRISSMAKTTADDGMEIWLYDGIEATALDELPTDETLTKMVKKLATDLTALRSAPRAEPYVGPAILRNKAAGVFFHETFGHRIEGHRQKDEEEGRTFAKKLGQKIMPDFITVVDDPTLQRFKTKSLNGYYRFDDQGVPAQKVVLVQKGILKNYLMSRSPIKGFEHSNGHGRCSPGLQPVARQGNLIVESSKRVPYAKLKQMLIQEAKRQHKPYGLVFDELAGGFTETQTFFPQSFKLLPLRVWRVWVDGRPDELLRGVDLVGTPLASLESIKCGADDDDTFNGTCGAESGWVPVSATSPSLLVSTVEVELQQKGQEKPPLLPAPLHDPENKAKASPEASPEAVKEEKKQ